MGQAGTTNRSRPTSARDEAWESGRPSRVTSQSGCTVVLLCSGSLVRLLVLRSRGRSSVRPANFLRSVRRRIDVVTSRRSLSTPGPHGVGEVAAGDGAGFVAAHAVGQEGHRQSEVGVSPADGGAEPAVPEGAHRARRPRPVPPWIGQSAQLEAESTTNRNVKGRDRSPRRPRPPASARPSLAAGCARHPARHRPRSPRRSGPCRGRWRHHWRLAPSRDAGRAAA